MFCANDYMGFPLQRFEFALYHSKWGRNGDKGFIKKETICLSILQGFIFQNCITEIIIISQTRLTSFQINFSF